MPESPAENESLELSEFKTESLAFEVRYDPTPLLWDKAGSVWAGLKSKLPETKMVNGEPTITSFTLGKEFQYTVALDRAFVVSTSTQVGFEDYIKVVETLLEVINFTLKIDEYKRIGLRQVFVKYFPSRSLASEALRNIHIVKVPQVPVFGIEAKPIGPDFAMRWEGENFGARVHVKIESRTLDFEIPPVFPDAAPPSIEQHVILLDIDYSTMGSVSVGQFRARDWLYSARSIVRKDGGKFIKGA
jgi:hypothetical protein